MAFGSVGRLARAALLVLGAWLVLTPSAAQQPPSGWKRLSAERLTLMAPPGTTLVPLRGVDSLAWRVSNSNFHLTIALGGGDGDVAEPALCYTKSPMIIDGRNAVLRIAKPNPRLDCPEKYVSLYIPARADGAALYISGTGGTQDDLSTIQALIATIHIADWR